MRNVSTAMRPRFGAAVLVPTLVLGAAAHAQPIDNLSALQFANTQARISHNPLLNLGDVHTVECWVKHAPQSGGGNSILEKWDNSQNDHSYNWVVRSNSPSGFFGAAYNGTGQSMRVDSGNSVADNEWRHIAYVRDGTDMRVYIDGVLDNTETQPQTSGPNSDDLIVGRRRFRPDTAYFGLIDEVRLWSYARTDEQIASVYNKRVPSDSPGLVAMYTFDEGSGQDVGDATPNALHGVLGETSGTEAIDAIWTTDTPPLIAGPCSTADYALPFGALDFSDVVAFLTAFGTMDPAADLAPPMGVFDFSDVVAFLGAFGAGCP